jgi:hypothetical protein
MPVIFQTFRPDQRYLARDAGGLDFRPTTAPNRAQGATVSRISPDWSLRALVCGHPPVTFRPDWHAARRSASKS